MLLSKYAVQTTMPPLLLGIWRDPEHPKSQASYSYLNSSGHPRAKKRSRRAVFFYIKFESQFSREKQFSVTRIVLDVNKNDMPSKKSKNYISSCGDGFVRDPFITLSTGRISIKYFSSGSMATAYLESFFQMKLSGVKIQSHLI